MIISYAVDTSSKLISSNDQANPQYAKWLDKNSSYTILEVETEDVLYCNTNNLKVSDGVVILKTEDDFKAERALNYDSIKKQLQNACMNYQTGETDPRIDPNFFSILTTSQTLKSISAIAECPKCDANVAWCDTLWADYESRKLSAQDGNVVSLDFSNNGNPPYSFDECRAELS